MNSYPITPNQKSRLSKDLNTSPEIVEILFPNSFTAGKMIQVLKDKFFLERLKVDSEVKGGVEYDQLFKYLDKNNYETESWLKILEYLRIK